MLKLHVVEGRGKWIWQTVLSVTVTTQDKGYLVSAGDQV